MSIQLLDSNGQPLAQDSAHRGASLDAREFSSWHPPHGSADADLIHELPTLVSRSRDLVRNHGVASGGIQTIHDNVVGSGLRLSARPDYTALGLTKAWADEWAKKTEALWRNYADSTDCDAANSLTFSGLTSQIFRASLVNGEALSLPLWLPKRQDTFATKFHVIESDRLCNPQGRMDSATLRAGIEIDRYGAPQAYWITKQHPGDMALNLVKADWQRIPAYTRFGRKRVIHIHDKERSGQNRGKPILSSIMPMFKMLDHYEKSELQAAVVNAMIAAFIETPLDTESISELFGGSSEDYLNARKDWSVQLKGGAVIPVFPGDKVAPFTPGRPNAAYGSFVENILRHIGTGLNLPYELLLKDFSKTNYSSARAALLEAWRYFLGRRTWISTTWATPAYCLWLEEAINKGLIEAPQFYDNKNAWIRCKWIGPGRGSIDPVKEANASEKRMQINTSTLEIECAAEGLDWEEVLEQRAREIQKQKDLGLYQELPEDPNLTLEEQNDEILEQGKP